MRNFEPMIPHLGTAVLAASALAVSCFGQALVGDSPFAARGGAGLAAAPAQAYELAGSATRGSQVTVCIFEREKQHSEWIPVGEAADGIRVVSYDAANDSAVVTVDGARKELAMRRAQVAALAPSADPRVQASGGGLVASLVPVATGPATPQSVAQDQREARMLVSDLLEIGVQQRKAYQEARQKAEAQSSPQPTN